MNAAIFSTVVVAPARSGMSVAIVDSVRRRMIDEPRRGGAAPATAFHIDSGHSCLSMMGARSPFDTPPSFNELLGSNELLLLGFAVGHSGVHGVSIAAFGKGKTFTPAGEALLTEQQKKPPHDASQQPWYRGFARHCGGGKRRR